MKEKEEPSVLFDTIFGSIIAALVTAGSGSWCLGIATILTIIFISAVHERK
jgi:hypothetical protein